jgi:hypothetical protein
MEEWRWWKTGRRDGGYGRGEMVEDMVEERWWRIWSRRDGGEIGGCGVMVERRWRKWETGGQWNNGKGGCEGEVRDGGRNVEGRRLSEGTEWWREKGAIKVVNWCLW